MEGTKITITARKNIVILASSEEEDENSTVILLNSSLTFLVGIKMIFATLLSVFPALIDFMNLCRKGYSKKGCEL